MIQCESNKSSKRCPNQLLENYYSGLYEALCKSIQSEELENPAIDFLTFWQFTKLPKILSERLFRAATKESKMILDEFLTCFQILSKPTGYQKKCLLFQMMDYDGDGRVTPSDLEIIVRHSQHQLAELNLKHQLFGIKESYYVLKDQFLSQSTTKILADQIFDFIEDVLQIKARLTLYSSIIAATHVPSLLQYLKDVSPRGTHKFGIFCKTGQMYRLVKEEYLKKYHYRLLGNVLYVYRNETDLEAKDLVYIGNSQISQQVPALQSEQDSQIYALRLQQPSGKKRIFYFLSQKEYNKWKICLLQGMGQIGDFHSFYKVGDKLGEGLEGEVSLGQEKRSNQAVALKIVKHQARNLQQEIQLEVGA